MMKEYRGRVGQWLCSCVFLFNGCEAPSEPNGIPEESRFTKTVLVSNLNEPMELAVLPDGNILFIERRGAVKLYDREKKTTSTLVTLSVFSDLEDGLLGLTLDPDFARNNFLYFYYSPAGSKEIQRVSRFTLDGQTLDLTTEKILLEIPVQRKECCHSAGSLTFGPERTLYIAVGDNTNPHNPGYYNSIDERVGREYWDAQRTASNTNDLRGKILRIVAEADGTYSIPEGNLFPKDGRVGKPEIYAMGCRNPYRIHVDQQTGYLYWGDVGQNTEDNPARGPISYDEFNQAKGPGFFGWPYFAGDNQPYTDFDFETNTNGKFFDAAKPINESRNNTGSKVLPPAQNAFIWYTYEEDTTIFKNLGSGGKSPVIGPVYYPPKALPTWSASPTRFPKYYEGKLFIAEWMRDWINVVTMDAKGDFNSIERFMPLTQFDHPIELEFGPDGALYLLEYGTFWFSQNTNARLSVVEYNPGNRAPVARLESNTVAGALPLSVKFSGDKSFDYDSLDELSFEWLVEGEKISDKTFTHQFVTAGKHTVQLTVSDNSGFKSAQTLSITAGNDYPLIDIQTTGNRTFFLPNRPIEYRVFITDPEDGTVNKGIEPNDVLVTVDPVDMGSGLKLIQNQNSGREETPVLSSGLNLIRDSDCKACHHAEIKSVGPTYKQIAERYSPGNQEVVSLLATKVIRGGSGTWGEVAMSAHPQISRPDAEEIINFLLAEYSPTKKSNRIPLQGTWVPDSKLEKDYLFKALYKDKGAGQAPPLTAYQYLLLRWPTLGASLYNDAKYTSKLNDGVIRFTQAGAYVVFDDIDLTDLKEVRYAIAAPATGTLELRIDAVHGALISETKLEASVGLPSFTTREVKSGIQPTKGLHDLYVLYKTPPETQSNTRNVVDLVFVGFK